MKAIIFIALIAFASAAFLQKDLSYEEWSQPQIDRINGKNSSWVAGHNEYFKGRSMNQIKSTLDNKPLEKFPPTKVPIKDEYPTSFDPYTEWPGCDSLHDIRNQANCGCCHAFASAESFSDRICIHSGQKLQTRISMVGCWCDFMAGWAYLAQTGAPTGLDYNSPPADYCYNYPIQPCCLSVEPCTTDLPTCTGAENCNMLPCPTFQCNSEYTKKTWAEDNHQSGPVTSMQGVDQMMAEIGTNGPIACQVQLYSSFLTYRSGVYNDQSGQSIGGHYIKVMGWGVQDSQPYWLVANSWSIYWGDEGYFKILKGDNVMQIESACVAGMPQASSLVVPE